MKDQINPYLPEDWNLFKRAIQFKFSEEINQIEFFNGYYKLKINGEDSYWSQNEIENIIKQYLRHIKLSKLFQN